MSRSFLSTSPSSKSSIVSAFVFSLSSLSSTTFEGSRRRVRGRIFSFICPDKIFKRSYNLWSKLEIAQTFQIFSSSLNENMQSWNGKILEIFTPPVSSFVNLGKKTFALTKWIFAFFFFYGTQTISFSRNCFCHVYQMQINCHFLYERPFRAKQ